MTTPSSTAQDLGCCGRENPSRPSRRSSTMGGVDDDTTGAFSTRDPDKKIRFYMPHGIGEDEDIVEVLG